MITVKEILKAQPDGTLSFGDYTLDTKTKVEDYEFHGNLYKVKTFSEITKLERDGMFVYESEPGTAVLNFKVSPEEVSFLVSGRQDAEITLELETDSAYQVFVDGTLIGNMQTNLSGKLTISVQLDPEKSAAVRVVKG